MKKNNKLDDALVSILEKIPQSVEKGVEFLTQELPDVIQQLLVWKFWESLLLSLLFVGLGVALCIVNAKFFHKKAKEESELVRTGKKEAFFNNMVELWLLTVICYAMGAAFIIGGLCCIKWLQILLAPKLYLIEYIGSMTK